MSFERKKSRPRRRFGSVVFFVPIAVLLALFLVAFVSGATNNAGVLIVRAQSSHYPYAPLHVSATVGAATGTTPFNLTLAAGSYTVTFSALAWYHTATPRTIEVVGGQTVYAVGLYVPIPVFVSVNQDGFNSTIVRAGHGITPVIWTNTGASVVELKSSLFSVALIPGQNYTRIFTSQGPVSVVVLGTNLTMQVDVI